MTESDGRTVVALVREELGSPEQWLSFPSNYGYRGSLALCVVDAVYSLRAQYTAVLSVVDRYRQARLAEGGAPDTDGLPELLLAIETHGGEGLFRNNAIAPGTRLRKYDVVEEAARRLLDAGCVAADDARGALADSDAAERLRRAWLSVRGLGPASWHYLVMLVGGDDVKADVWIGRFVSRALRVDVGPTRARDAVLAAAELAGVSSTALDHAIWLAERARRA